MLIGAHVSTAGGLYKSIERATEIGCTAMQIFSQSPRTWRPTAYTDDDFAKFRTQMAASQIESVVIHASYLINCGSADAQLNSKSVAALINTLKVGDAIGADGVVLHPGSSKDSTVERAIERIGAAVAKALAETEFCPLLFENTAGAGQTVGRSFQELAELVNRVEIIDPTLGKRVGICLDSCHLFASGIDVRTPDAFAAALDDFDAAVGIGRLKCLHLNDSKMPLGSNRDRHENLGDGEIGRKGIEAFLGEPQIQDLPVLLEVPGPEGKGPEATQVKLAKALHCDGVRSMTR